jgi:serine/threonine protein kinase
MTGKYFLIKRNNENGDAEITKNLPINLIYTGQEKSWEEGFSDFVRRVRSKIPQDENALPVVSTSLAADDIPPPHELIRNTPDEIRTHLAAATKKFYKNDIFDYESYRIFCKKYDTAIHISTRINPNDSQQSWLGNRITTELGRGNFGRVYQAFNSNEESIAIKVAHMEVRDDEAMLNSFRRGVDSMRFLSKSEIPGVVRLIDASEIPPSIIMEYVQGVDLQKYINDNYAGSILEKLNIFRWISEIIFECHSHERIILHRDLRPSNIMITGEYWERVTKEDIRILDFDLSWFQGASGAEFYMNASQALGFLAPEQIDSRSVYSNRSALVDVYGLGMLLYFMVSREIPNANASTRSDWRERVRNASAYLFHKDWKSSKNIFETLVVSCTNEKQNARPKLLDLIDKVNILLGIMEGRFPFDADSCILEILGRLSPGGAEIDFDRNKRQGRFVSGAGAIVELGTDGRVITCTIKRTLGEGANRITRGKILTDALFKARSKIETFAKVDERNTSTFQGGNQIRFSFDVISNLKDMNAVAGGIDFAAVEISRD